MIAERTHHLDMDVCQCDWMVERIRRDDAYAQNFYAALCDRSWREDDAWEILSDRTWRVSWRTAGAIVSDIRVTNALVTDVEVERAIIREKTIDVVHKNCFSADGKPLL